MTVRCFVSTLLLLVWIVPAFAQGDIPPTLFRSDMPEYPTWVEAAAAFDEAGAPRADQFHPSWAQNLSDHLGDGQLLNRVTGCVELGSLYSSWVDEPVRRSLTEATRTSGRIVAGTVAATSPGFFEGQPGQLLRLVDIEAVKGDALAEHFVFWAEAEFSAGGHQICKTDHRLPPAPSAGDRLIVYQALTSRGFSDLQPIITTIYNSNFVVLYADGAVGAEKAIREWTTKADLAKPMTSTYAAIREVDNAR